MQHSGIAAPLIIRTFLNTSTFILTLLHLVFFLFRVAIKLHINKTNHSNFHKITLNNHIVIYDSIYYQLNPNKILAIFTSRILVKFHDFI